MKILNAMQLKAGAKAEHQRLGTITQPVQFLPRDQKDEAWGAWNMDWYEMQGLKQMRRNAHRLLKNYKLANGIIDRQDYVPDDTNENSELIDVLTAKQEGTAYDLKFFPIIPNVINVLSGEFAKRNDRIMYRAVDEQSHNELLEAKRAMVEQVLLSQAEAKVMQQMIEMGMDMESEEAAQALDPQQLKTLPEIEEFFRKDYRSMIEEWSMHQHRVDEERFHLKEMESMAFKDMLITDREFWHFKMNEDDYEVEVWNPVLTFYHKSPDVRYISQGNWVGRVDLMSVADVIDKYGYQMDADQLKSLEAIYPVKASLYPIAGYQNDGSFYDATRSHEWNTQGASLGYRQFVSVNDHFLANGDDMLTHILNESEDLFDYGTTNLLRVTTVYWKSQRMVGHLTRIEEDGSTIQMLVDENYKVTTKPVYNTTVVKQKSAETLLFGEHVEWIWINEVWGGVKVGPNRPSFYGNAEGTGIQPIYLGVKPVKFQFKGDFTPYGCKLPVEGAVFSDRNTKSISLVDRMKPYQIGYNLVNNQIADILIDELGTIIMLDQNALPKSSMGEDWGPNNYANAFVAMKNFQMLPLDTSITNTENPLNFQHYQVLNLEQTNRLMSRIQLANYFKQQAFESIGISMQRLGAVNAQETATGVQQAINQSFSQTENYFTQHSEYLMPRVHQMRTDLAQYYHSKKPSVRLSYITSMDEKVNFQMNGTELLARDLNIFVTTKVNQKQIMEQIRQLALNNNTSGASIYDLGNLLKADSLAEITHVLKSVEEKIMMQKQQEQQTLLEQERMRQEGENARVQAELQFEAEQKQLDRETDIAVAEIRGAGYQVGDLNENKQSDYMDAIDVLEKRRQKDDEINLKREAQVISQNMEQQQLDLKRQELQTRRDIARSQVEVARTNKNRYDKKGGSKGDK